MNAPAAESIARIQPGSHSAPCSITPTRSVGKRSRMPSKIIVASVCIGASGIAMYDTDVKLSSPPWKSGTGGRPFSLYVSLHAAGHRRRGRRSGCRPPGRRPTAGRSRCASGPGGGGTRRDHQRRGAERRCASRPSVDGLLGRRERHPAHREQPGVDGAEVDDAAVVGRVAAAESASSSPRSSDWQRAQVVRREDELALEPELVERGDPVVRDRTRRGRRGSCAAGPGRRSRRRRSSVWCVARNRSIEAARSRPRLPVSRAASRSRIAGSA